MSEPHQSSSPRNGAAHGDEQASPDAVDDPLSPRSTPPPTVNLILESDDIDPPLTGWLDHHLARIAQIAKAGPGHINVLIVDDPTMAQVHQQYLGENDTTDVLSFDLRDPENPRAPLEIDLVICIDQARRQAHARGHDTRLEALLYAVHGLLHMLGENDATPDDAHKMHQREDQLLVQAGFKPVYDTHDPTRHTT